MIKNLLVGLGTGYHHQVRLLHTMVKDKCDSSMMFFSIERVIDSIGENLRLYSSMKDSDFKNTFQVFRKFLKENKFDVIGIGMMSHHWFMFLEMSKIIREELPNCKIICGGVHPWHISPYETLEYCDYICAAEGEELYSTLVDRLTKEKNSLPLRIPGLIEKYKGEVICTHVKNYMPIDDLPFPTYGDKNTYTLSAKDGDKPVFLNEDPLVNSEYGYIHVGRGCVFRCTFCINAVVSNPIARIRSVDRVIHEIKDMLRVCKKVKGIMFNDEIFPVRQTFLPEFCEKYKKEIDLPFTVTLYPHMLNEEKISKLKSAGLKEISMGLQSGSERIRNDIYERKDTNKRLLDEKNILSKHQVMTYYDIIIKNPWETEDDLEKSLDLIHSFKHPYFLKFYTLAYYPKHPITNRALKEKRVDPKEVDPTIGYLEVTTPHKVALVEHYHEDSTFIVWHKRLRKKMINGSLDESYYLLMCYHGVWFMPQFILNFLYKNFKKKNKFPLYVFSYIMESVFVVRNLKIISWPSRAILKWRQKGSFM